MKPDAVFEDLPGNGNAALAATTVLNQVSAAPSAPTGPDWRNRPPTRLPSWPLT